MADDQDYLDELIARRRTIAGVKQTVHADQSTTFDQEALEREIARVERVVRGHSGTRLARTSKGV